MGYTGQAPAFSTEEVEAFLLGHATARFCTRNRDGTIHAVPVGYLYRDGQFVVGSYAKSRKRANVERNPRVTLLIDAEEPFRGVLVYGSAVVETTNVTERLIDLFATSGTRAQAEAFCRAYLEVVDWVVITVTPERMVTFDYGKDDVFNTLWTEHFG